jgi:ribosomal protein S27E
VWEHGAAAPPGRRALELAGLARPELVAGERDTLTAGERDAALFDLRERVFGSAIEAVVACTGCGETLELASAIDELRTEGAPQDTAESRTLSHAGYEIVFRLPTALDLAEIAHEIDLGQAHDDLLGRCVLEASVEGQAIEARELPGEVVDALDAALAAADPQADLELAVECPTCGHSSVTHFDIASFLWLELERFALETLREVHVLAVAYGWSESQILALGARRRLYLELIDG